MARRVEVCWSSPTRWDARRNTLIHSEPAKTNGIYQLTRVWGDRDETLLYIGIVWSDTRTMLKRMEEHRGTWLGALRGINYRFGAITPVRGLTRGRALLETIEGAMVCELQPPENTSKRKWYSSWGDLVIHNRFDRGALPLYVDMTNHIDI
jgi:hypothetical protein